MKKLLVLLGAVALLSACSPKVGYYSLWWSIREI